MSFNVSTKIKNLDEIAAAVQRHRNRGKKIVLTHGVFDLLHYGHIHYLEQAKKLGDILVVSVVGDKFIKKGFGGPVFNQNIRANSIAALSCVDYLTWCKDLGPWEIIEKIKPDIYAKGESSARQLEDPGSGLSLDKKTVEKIGGRLVFTKFLPIHSSQLLNEHFRIYPEEIASFLKDFRRKYNASDIISRIEDLKNLKVMVIGEAIIDEYCYVLPLGKGPSKANIISTQYLGKEEFAGGALACANHVSGICKNVELVTYLGEKDSREDFIRAHLEPGIKPKFFYCPNRPTIVKTRYLDSAYFSKFFEVDVLDKNYLPKRVEAAAAKYLNENTGRYDMVIVIDYGHGFLSEKLIKIITKKAKFLAVNTQTNSANAGFNYITKYSQADFVCLDEIEARLAVQDNFSRIDGVVLKLAKRISPAKIIVTLGPKGSIAHEKNQGLKRTPALTDVVKDLVGTGDAFLAISAPCAAAGYPLELVSFIGNVAGSVAAQILGNKFPVALADLYRYINSLLA